jgi:hypothetical protein
MRKLPFDLAQSVAKYRNTFLKSVAEVSKPVVTEEMKLQQKQAIKSAKVVYKLTSEDHEHLSKLLEESRSSTLY